MIDNRCRDGETSKDVLRLFVLRSRPLLNIDPLDQLFALRPARGDDVDLMSHLSELPGIIPAVTRYPIRRGGRDVFSYNANPHCKLMLSLMEIFSQRSHIHVVAIYLRKI